MKNQILKELSSLCLWLEYYISLKEFGIDFIVLHYILFIGQGPT